MTEIKDFSKIEDINSYLTSQNNDLIFCIDANIEKIYSKEFQNLKSKYKSEWFVFPEGETAKSISEWEKSVEYFLNSGINRKTTLVAIGGGALSDVSGFVASTLLRGIEWIVVPTTILSQIDASIGGKVAVNSRYGKNLIGNFHQPKEVLICDEFLTTLESKEVLSGYGELLKYAYIDNDIFELIKKESSILNLMKACAQIKLNIINQDPLESGLRKILNLGHTFGHVIEWKYKLSHGISVLWGMAIIFKLFNQENELNKLHEMIKKLKINKDLSNPINNNLDADEFFQVLTKDKKLINTKSIELIIVDEKKAVVVKEYDLVELRSLFKNKMRDICAITFN